MFYTITKIQDTVFDGQEQSHFQVNMFEDEEKTISIGIQTLILSGDLAKDPDTAFLNGINRTAQKDTSYVAMRSNAYPSIQDQLDLMYHGGYDAWKSAIQAVKEEFPK